MPSLFNHLFSVNSRIPESIYDFRITAIDGGIIDFSQFRGRKILIVNTASLCGFTPQYEELEKLYRQFKDRLVVVGFPSNNFLFQEPGSNEKIATFCRTKFDVTFPLAAKVTVKGWWKAPIYKWLTRKKHNGFSDSTVKWNFQKYLLNGQGQLTHIFSHKTSPLSPEIIAAVEA